MDRYLESFVRKTYFHHHRCFQGSKCKVMTYQRCIKTFIICGIRGFARGKINLGTLEILELQGKLRGKEEALNRRIIDRNISTINQQNEFQSFFIFLKKEFPRTYNNIQFLKSERPDFLLKYEQQIIGIEVTEAIDGKDAKLRGEIYKSHIHERRPLGVEGSMDRKPSLETLLLNRIREKKEKFKNFQILDQNILIVIANHPEYKSYRDIQRIKITLEGKKILEGAPFSLVVMNMVHNIYGHFRWVKDEILLQHGQDKQNHGMK